MDTISNYVNGELIAPASAGYKENEDPAQGKTYSRSPDSHAGDVNIAVTAATEAFHEWANMPVEKRSIILMRISELIDRDLGKEN